MAPTDASAEAADLWREQRQSDPRQHQERRSDHGGTHAPPHDGVAGDHEPDRAEHERTEGVVRGDARKCFGRDKPLHGGVPQHAEDVEPDLAHGGGLFGLGSL